MKRNKKSVEFKGEAYNSFSALIAIFQIDSRTVQKYSKVFNLDRMGAVSKILEDRNNLKQYDKSVISLRSNEFLYGTSWTRSVEK